MKKSERDPMELNISDEVLDKMCEHGVAMGAEKDIIEVVGFLQKRGVCIGFTDCPGGVGVSLASFEEEQKIKNILMLEKVRRLENKK